ncbi:MAG: TonB-dependent receptor [Pseudomonadota bacterium]
MKVRNRRNSWVVVTGTMVFSVANAQTAPAPKPEPVEEMMTVSVTGTRLVLNGNRSKVPLTVIDTETIGKLQPSTLTEQISLMPALQGSQNVTSNPGGGQRNGAAAYFNLRNMGDLRTLVMVDGFRLVPTINQNQANVDASVIPQMLLKRVDVVTGGVSAVYGSDAISGVINFITDTNFNGVKVQASTSRTGYHDGGTVDFGVAAGTKILKGKGHVEFSYQHHDDPGIFDKSSRPFFQARTGGAGTGTAANPYRNILDQRISNTAFGGLIPNVAANGTLKDMMFTPSGALTPFVHGVSAGVANVESGGSGGYFNTSSLKSSIKFDQVFGRADFDLPNGMHAFAQGSYSDIRTANNFQSPNFSNLRISNANPFLSGVQAPYNAALAANPAGTFTFSRLFENEPRAEQITKSYSIVTGLNGTLFDSYKWNVGLQLAESKMQASNLFNIDNGRLFASVDAVRNASGQIVCRASLTNANYAGCVPLNLFGVGAASANALDYIYKRTDNINRTQMENFSGSITGAPFSTWAGPIKMAVSTELRRLRWDVRSNAGPNDLADCLGIAYNCTTGGTQATRNWFANTQGSLDTVTQRVAEGAIEANIPLVRDVPFIQSFDVSAAARYTHYNLSGGVSTNKLGANWDVNDHVSLRATRSRDIRAPNLFELYAPVQINPGTTLTDIHTGTQGVVPNRQTSNPALTPEKADTTTLGVVFTPKFIPGFSMSVDYFNIKVKDVIFLLAGRSDQAQAQCEASGGTSPICDLIVRPLPFSNRTSANFPTSTSSTFLNIAELDTWGTDVEANYKTKLFKRVLTLRTLFSYQPKLRYDQGPLGTIDLGNAFTGVNLFPAAPSKKVTAIVSYDVVPDVNLTVMHRWRGKMKVTALEGPVLENPILPSLGYTTINLSWKVPSNKGEIEAFFNIANAFNKFPTIYYPGPVNNPGAGLGLPAGDDPIGRNFTLGVRMKF